jgi:hypothetical protein
VNRALDQVGLELEDELFPRWLGPYGASPSREATSSKVEATVLPYQSTRS